jgi:TolA-binding protein
MKKINFLNALFLVIPLITSCSLDYKAIEKKAENINRYEIVSLKLQKENRELKVKITKLNFEIESLKHKKIAEHPSDHQIAEVDSAKDHPKNDEEGQHHDNGRAVASVAPTVTNSDGKKDFVEFKTYKWRADDLMKIADKEFKEKHYDKAAQFYTSLLNNYPNDKNITDEFYFKGGIASYESGQHYDWSLLHFEALKTKYPTSQYYRSAKLWVALTHMKMGDKKIFYATVEEFRIKYRNTNEWKILSTYYKNIEEKANE